MKIKFAIKGHDKRGNEVINILKMLGGYSNLSGGTNTNCVYFINDCNTVNYTHVDRVNNRKDIKIFTLEEFLKKYPYKVGDKVIHHGEVKDIISAEWCLDQGTLFYRVKGEYDIIQVYDSVWLYPYEPEVKVEDTPIDYVKESNDRYRIVLNHKFDMVVDEGEYYAVKRKPKYPNTYSDCFYILYGHTECEFILNGLDGVEYDLFDAFIQLKRCRDAYYKIAGEELGLDKPWKPDWTNNHQKKYTICFYQGEISLTNGSNVHRFLAFPTEEMRDLFYKHFKILIDKCKELL